MHIHITELVGFQPTHHISLSPHFLTPKPIVTGACASTHLLVNLNENYDETGPSAHLFYNILCQYFSALTVRHKPVKLCDLTGTRNWKHYP